MVERSEKRSEAGDAINEQLYFEQLFQCFSTFVKRFPVLLKDPPWKYLAENKLHLFFGKSAEGGFLMYWKEAESKTNTVHHVKCAEIIKMAGQTDDTVPSPLFLIPSDVIRKYHPLELVYIWVIRSVYDILAFTGIRGGIPINDTYKQSKINPAIPIITNRFLLYHEITENLPSEVINQLPFYANKAFKLAIEVINYLQPPVILYAIMPSPDPEKVDIIQSILEEGSAPGMFRKIEGVWHLSIGEKHKIVPDVEEVSFGQLMTEIPGSVSQYWLAKDLKNILPLFPPEEW
jgi:hypothetical protein